MGVEFKIGQRGDGEFEAEAVLKFYAAGGYYKIDVLGLGRTEKAAKANAEVMLGQAKAALHVATNRRFM